MNMRQKDDEAERRGTWVPDNCGPDLPAPDLLPLIEERKENLCLFNVADSWVFHLRDSAKPNTN